MQYPEMAKGKHSMFGKTIAIVFLFIYIVLLAGCDMIVYSPKQPITVTTINDKTPLKTRCVLQNEEGLWKVMPNSETIIHRDGNVLQVQCVNVMQIGNGYLRPNFDGGRLAFDIMLFCVMCPYDAYYNTMYSYAPFISILMRDKKDIDFIDPLLQRGGR